jgi:hypothetical protein
LTRLLFHKVGFQCVGWLLFQALVVSYPDLRRIDRGNTKVSS